jgi:DNA-directed RNA polymerase subunit RPC12/RpoP
MYKCINCGSDVSEKDLQEMIRCPFCGYRILKKKRPDVIRTVKAR